ncbi:carboxypeptidase B-like [Ochlerotatus camptorhynchus]|uniref:carboxypeptidase B-like n=1 Tax=Ochlerotatus camptorhynchus TaxID=644619 RepID=UPI0031E4798F
MIQIFGAVWLLSALLASAFSADDIAVSYKNYKLYDVQPSTRAELELLHRVSSELDLDFWSPPALDRNSSVMVSPWNDDSLRAYLSDHNVKHRVLYDDVQSVIDREHVYNQNRARKRRSVEQTDKRASFDYFWSMDEIYQYLDYLALEYPSLVRLKDYGKSYEGRPIKVITISTNGEVDDFRPIVLIDGGIHAREWAGHMSVLYLIHQLVERSAENMDLLNKTNWVIMPVVNPDGYVYTYEHNRLWRKNRAPVNMLCIGTDLNRNFPFRWKYYGSQCSSGYAGPTPGSELETRAVMLMMANYAKATKVYLAVHSCGDYILYPYGYDYVDAPNKVQLQELGDKAAEAVKAIGGPEYAVGSASFLLYPANGSDDFIYGSYGVEYVYTLELSCGAMVSDGFIISVAEMQKISKEAFEMFKVFGKFAGEQKIIPLGSNRKNNTAP